MEPKLVRKDIKYQKKTLAIVSVLVISLFLNLTVELWEKGINLILDKVKMPF